MLTANLVVAAYNLAIFIFIQICMAFRIYPRHLGLPDGNSGFLMFAAIWLVGAVIVWVATYRAVSRRNS